MTTYRVWKEHLKSSAPKATEKYTKEIGLVLYIGVKKTTMILLYLGQNCMCK
jgi:hypothetical protein